LLAGGVFVASCNSNPQEKKAGSQANDAELNPEHSKESTELICGDYSNVSKEELDKRKKLGYADKSPDPERECVECNLYIPNGQEKKCGGCILFQGPVNAEGTCTYWAEQVS